MYDHLNENDHYKIFNDAGIHGYIKLHPLLVKIIDTEPFQRLRSIKQVGSVSFVYPRANHTRFEHSIGTAYLAHKQIKHLQNIHFELNITETEVLCVSIAALIHDLGHGPHSHFFDNKYMKGKWKHEKGTMMMLDYICENNKNIINDFHKYNIYENELKIIKYMIDPCNELNIKKGREFLFEIVSNKRNGIDVDKFDYLLRDSLALGIKIGFDPIRLIQSSKILSFQQGENYLGYNEREFVNIIEMFHCRRKLHELAYHHKTAIIIDRMFYWVLKKAENIILFCDEQGNLHTIEDCVKYPAAYLKLSDYIFQKIEYSKKRDLAESQKILKDIKNRKIYTFLMKMENNDKNNDEIIKNIEFFHTENMNKWPSLCQISLDNILHLEYVFIDYGTGENDSLFRIYLYRKNKLQKNKPYIVEKLLNDVIPSNYKKEYIYFYLKLRWEENQTIFEELMDLLTQYSNKIK